ncbi:hypothetical protein [Chromohalobacter sp. 296-RDG]|uniref:hypothetical protein n=1 Tax=Chromohalobacter sp. 296-RDG TaxID=2994062 RepID=UPI00246932B0|nr:hypothetical protein [Chromohalobacter sp. 296-RDG]
MKKQLILHIGCHKTGTTSIQHALVDNKNSLQDIGYTYYYEGYEHGGMPNFHSYLAFDQNKGLLPLGMWVRDHKKMIQDLSSVEGNVIVSSENFSFVFDKKEVARIKRSLYKVFDSILVVCYIRRQDRHVISHHQEGAKPHRRAEYDLFGHEPTVLPKHKKEHDLYLDYYTRLGWWADEFGEDNIFLRVYDRKALKDGDVVADFFNIMGLDEFYKSRNRNTSLTGVQARGGHLIQGRQSEFFDHIRLYNTFISIGSPRGKGLISKEDALDYYGNYKEGNRLLNKKYCLTDDEYLFDEDFSEYSDFIDCSWAESNENEVIFHFLKWVDSLHMHVDVDALRDAALELENKNKNLSYKLMLLARFFRPQGPLINRKLEKYSEDLFNK